jgi:branched-chain amino acid transport system permease protein
LGAVTQYLKRRWGAGIAIVCLVLLPYLPVFSDEFILRWLVQACLLAGMAIALDFTVGYINVVNFGFAGFVGAGAYVSAIAAIRAGWSPWITIFLGAAIALILGFFLGVLTLRTRGIFAAIVAWFFGLSLIGLDNNWHQITGGQGGLTVPYLFASPSNMPYFYVAAGMLVVSFLILAAVVESRVGLAFRALGQNLESARASGINPTRYRILSFTISCAFAGWFGGFYAHYYGILTPTVMDTTQTVTVLVVVFLGGRGSLWGPAVVAFPFVFGTQELRLQFADRPGLDLLTYGVLLVLVTIFYPGGLAEGVRAIRQRMAGKLSTRSRDNWALSRVFNARQSPEPPIAESTLGRADDKLRS